MREPLAIKMRPKKIEDIIGQSHLLKEGRIEITERAIRKIK